MALNVVRPREIAYPDIPYDKLLYNISIDSEIVNGDVVSRAQLALWRCRVLSNGKWEKDPEQRQPIFAREEDIYALAGQVPEVAAAIPALHAAVVAINTVKEYI